MIAPRVSVLMTAYNRERWVADAIEGVLKQTLTDFELIIVDDRSTDGTAAIAAKYASGDSRVRLIVNERNLGDYANRNRAAEFATAPLMKYQDSDDLMYPHCLDVMVRMIEAQPDAGFGLSASRQWPGGPCPMLLTPRMAYQREYLGGGLFFCGPSSAIFRTDVFRGLGGFVDRGAPSDYFFWLRACTRVNVALLPGDLFWYRVHEGQNQVSSKTEPASVAGEAWRALDAPQCPLTPSEREQARRNRAYYLAKRTWQDVRGGRVSVAWQRLRGAGLSVADWAKYLRPLRVDRMAGTPVHSDGEYVMPRWLS